MPAPVYHNGNPDKLALILALVAALCGHPCIAAFFIIMALL